MRNSISLYSTCSEGTKSRRPGKKYCTKMYRLFQSTQFMNPASVIIFTEKSCLVGNFGSPRTVRFPTLMNISNRADLVVRSVRTHGVMLRGHKTGGMSMMRWITTRENTTSRTLMMMPSHVTTMVMQFSRHCRTISSAVSLSIRGWR